MKTFEELRKITNKEEQIEVMKMIQDWYDEYKGINPIIPKSKKELKEYIDKCLKDSAKYFPSYGSMINIKVMMDIPCMSLNLEDETFVGHYYEVINQFEKDCDWHPSEVKEEILEPFNDYLKTNNIKKEAIKTEIKMIKDTIEVINNISNKTNDEIWDMGVIETGYEIYTTLEKECQKIINELNINFNLMEYGSPTESIPKAIELIEKEIL